MYGGHIDKFYINIFQVSGVAHSTYHIKKATIWALWVEWELVCIPRTKSKETGTVTHTALMAQGAGLIETR